MSDKHRKRGIDFWLLPVGFSLLGVSSILSLIYYPMFLHPYMARIDGEIKLAKEEVGYLDSAYQEKVYGELKSLIQRLDLDRLLLDHPEETQLISQRSVELMEVERGILDSFGRAVLDDIEYQKKALQWETMTYDQIQIEKQLIQDEFYGLKDSYGKQTIEAEEALMPLLSWEVTILSVIPVLFITGTVLTQISAFRKYEKETRFTKKFMKKVD